MAKRVFIPSIVVALLMAASQAPGQFIARDPGVRGGTPGAGAPLPGLTEAQQKVFEAGLEDFQEEDTLASGLGPRFNLDNCAGCHLQPAVGGTSPRMNPQIDIATAHGARNVVPRFITRNGPVREARFKYKADGSRDGGVQALFVISGRNDGSADADDCTIRQPDFERHLSRNNVVFRIPTPVFGLGLIEQIPDAAIVANLAATASQRAALGVRGRPHVIQPSGIPTATATTAPSRGSAGRRRTSRGCCSPARPTTSSRASPTSCSRPSATRRRRASTRRCPTTRRTWRG